jgi:hypothetical protein
MMAGHEIAPIEAADRPAIRELFDAGTRRSHSAIALVPLWQ